MIILGWSSCLVSKCAAHWFNVLRRAVKNGVKDEVVEEMEQLH